MTSIDGYPNTRARGDETVAEVGGCGPEHLLLIATVGAWRTLGGLDRLLGEHDLLHPWPIGSPENVAWTQVRDGIAAEVMNLCALLDVLDPEQVLRRKISDGSTAPAGSPPAACPAAQPEATLSPDVVPEAATPPSRTRGASRATSTTSGDLLASAVAQ